MTMIKKEKSLWTITPVTVDLNETRVNTKRHRASDNLFEIVAKFIIHPDGVDGKIEKAKLPNVSKCIASVAGGGDFVGITLDSELLIFEKSLEPASQVLEFDSSIDFIVWRRSVLLIGLASSEIVLVNPSTYEIKESKKIVPNSQTMHCNRFFCDAFIHSNPDPRKIDVMAVGVNGAVYSFENISLSDGSLDFTHDENTSLEIDIGSIKGTVKKYLKDGSKVKCTTSPSRNMLITGEENGIISLFELEGDICEENDFRFFRSDNIIVTLGYCVDAVTLVKVVRCEGLLFVLLSNGKLEILLDEELFPTDPLELPSSSYGVHDFTLVLSGTDVKLWALFGSLEGKRDENFIGIFNGPSFKSEFIVKIPESPEQAEHPRYCFPTQSSPYEEPFAFLEVSQHSTVVYQMSETSTDATLQKLLAKSRFEQALQLAVNYEKDSDVVNKAKVKARLIEILSTKNKDEAAERISEGLFEDLLKTLAAIKDAEFICEFSTQLGLPKIEWVKELLITGMKRVSECSSSLAAKNILLTRKKFYTFEQVFPTGKIQEWEDFSKEENTMYLQCLWFLQNFEFEKCERVWRRHSDEFIPEIDLAAFGPFLAVLFAQKLNTPETVSLFKTILPYAVEKCVYEDAEETMSISVMSCTIMSEDINITVNQTRRLDGMMELIIKQVRSLEREMDWPSGAMNFISILISAVEKENSNLVSRKDKSEPRTVKSRVICSEILTRLQNLLQTLTELLELKLSHTIRIPFQDYTQEKVVDVVNLMLSELFVPEEIERFVCKFLKPFAARKNLELDDLFMEHILTVVSHLQYFMNTIEIPYEERLVCLVNFITSPKTKLDCVLKLADEWSVPWSSGIDGLVVRILEMKVDGDPECLALQKTIKLMRIQVPFRCLLHKYRLTGSKLQTYNGVYMAILRILKSKKENFNEDCLELIKHTGKLDVFKIKALKSRMDLMDDDVPIENVVPKNFDNRLLRRLLVRNLQEFKNGPHTNHSPEQWEKITIATRSLATRLDDINSLQFLKIRELIAETWNVDITCAPLYPYCILNSVLPSSHLMELEEIVEKCLRLGDITFHHGSDILVTAAAFFVQTNIQVNSMEKLWGIVSTVVKTPELLHDPFVENAGVRVAYFLVQQCPIISNQKMEILHAFLRLLCCSFVKLLEPVAKLLGVLHIFETLREQEIPLEKEYLYIYNSYYFEGNQDFQQFLLQLKSFGCTLLKFGERDVFNQVFTAIQKENLGKAVEYHGQKDIQTNFQDIAGSVKQLQEQLENSYEEYQELEYDSRVVNLVEELNEVGLSVNAYALRQRNKTKLLSKLLEIKNYGLAAEIALVFDVKDKYSWSQILKGFMILNDREELQKVLESLKHITELWMLPEFASAWLKVSEKDPGFKNMCPIPLD